MKKVLSVLVCVFMICPAFATGDATPTSKGYVDAQMATLQDNLPGAVANTVLTTTDTAGETGTKAIYDSTGNYLEQQNALVTAEDANTAIQMAIQGELVCREYDPTGQYCYVYDVHPTVRNNILPNGYTALEYLQGTGEQYIDTGIVPDYTDCVSADLSIDFVDNAYRALFGAASDGYVYKFYVSVGGDVLWFANTNRGSPSSLIDTVNDITVCLGTPESVLKINGTEKGRTTVNLESGHTVKLFARNSHEPKAKMKVYSFELTRGTDNVILKFIPARRNSDGELGMYDTISNTFFTNAGTGKFLGPNYLPSGN